MSKPKSLTTTSPPRLTMQGDVRRGTALCIVDSYTFGACDCRDYQRIVVVGLAPKDLMDGDEVQGLFVTNTVNGILHNAHPGEAYYMDEYGLPRQLHEIPVGAFLVRLGVALSPSDLYLQISYGGRKQSATSRFMTGARMPPLD